MTDALVIRDAQRYIVCAAIRLDDEIVCGPRHYDETMRRQCNKRIDRDRWFGPGVEQGFVDQFGIFLTRTEAYTVTVKAGQIRRPLSYETDQLYSEQLY